MLLQDIAFGAIGPCGRRFYPAIADNLDIGAFTGKDRLAHVMAQHGGRRVVFKKGRQQVGVAGKQLPQQRQQCLVGQNAFPQRLQEAGTAGCSEAAYSSRCMNSQG